jgi:dephospho-CoA kinase
MLKVGLTGGIGCGKSTTCDLFAHHGVPIIDTDKLARDAVARGSKTLTKLITEFGRNILQSDGDLDRGKLRKLVFSDPELLNKLEEILHPEIRRLLAHQLENISSPYVIIAIPLLIEKNWQDSVDRILVIDCSVESQIQRVLDRDNDSQEGIQRIIDTQVGRDTRLSAADDIIQNDTDLAALQTQVDKLHLYYTQLVSINNT